MKKKICYKIVRVERDGTMRSTNAAGLFRVWYEIGKLAEPTVPGTPLFALKTERDARDLCERNWEVILECEYTENFFGANSRRTPFGYHTFFFEDDGAEAMHNNWQQEKVKHSRSQFSHTTPDGTILVTSLTPIRIIGGGSDD